MGSLFLLLHGKANNLLIHQCNLFFWVRGFFSFKILLLELSIQSCPQGTTSMLVKFSYKQTSIDTSLSLELFLIWDYHLTVTYFFPLTQCLSIC